MGEKRKQKVTLMYLCVACKALQDRPHRYATTRKEGGHGEGFECIQPEGHKRGWVEVEIASHGHHVTVSVQGRRDIPPRL